MLAVCARNRSLIGTPFSANWDTWGFDDPHKTQPRPTGAFFEGWLTAGSACRRNQKTIISHLRPELHMPNVAAQTGIVSVVLEFGLIPGNLSSFQRDNL
jgi:hypothetical protein